jgi:hypothetical protein
MAHHCRSLLDPPYKPMNNRGYSEILASLRKCGKWLRSRSRTVFLFDSTWQPPRLLGDSHLLGNKHSFPAFL